MQLGLPLTHPICQCWTLITKTRHSQYFHYERATGYNKILSQLKPELVERFDVNSIGFFGSVVRDDYKPSSDVDIIVDFNKQVGVEFIDLANYIEVKLKKPVHLVSKKGIKDSYFKEIEPEIVYI